MTAGLKGAKGEGKFRVSPIPSCISRRALLIENFQVIASSYREEAGKDKGQTFPGIVGEKSPS